jgi:hypothetical protein
MVSQAGYLQSSGGSSCCGQTSAPASTTIVVPSAGQTIVVPGMQNGHPAATSGMSAPEVDPSQQIPSRTFQKPGDSGNVEPVPNNGTSPSGTTPSNGSAVPMYETPKTDSNANYFEAPKLFNPNDRTAVRVAAPVHNAIYEKPASYRQISTGLITPAQAQQDSAGWTSASK